MNYNSELHLNMTPALRLYCPLFLSPLDPSIKPKPTAEVDPTVFEKRFLRKVRDLGEVTAPAVFTSVLHQHLPEICISISSWK